MKKALTAALCQMAVLPDKDTNLKTAREMVKQAADQGARLISLPEMFNGSYQPRVMEQDAELYPGKTSDFLASLAQELQITLVGGSIAEKDRNGRLYNTSFVFGPRGELLARHRKMHLFDIDIPGKVTFQESSVLSAGNDLQIFEVDGIKAAVIICYDVRFPEIFRILADRNVEVVLVPAAFTIPTGAVHWEITMRTRAIDNQIFLLAISPARVPESDYQPWGHSLIADPWGQISGEAQLAPEIIVRNLDLGRLAEVRAELPLLQHRRTDLYQLTTVW